MMYSLKKCLKGLMVLRLVSFSFLCCFLASCGGGGSNKEEGLGNTKVYKSSSPYANALKPCIQAEEIEDSCLLSSLPLIGMEVDNPSIDDIMDFVVVSHNWMGQRFEQVLAELSEDILTLLKGVTAIVIDDDIRPSYYTTLTGAIYLDPANLWLTNSEKATINQKADFRSGFSDPLQFRSLWRYVDEGEYAYQSYSLSGTEERQLEDIILRIAALLFHELAHANDFFPPDTVDTLSRNQSVVSAASNLVNQRISTRLYSSSAENSPLVSATMYSLAGVMYRGEEPSTADLSILGDEVGEAFEVDEASDDYAYTSIFEDVAMAFEEAMMKHHFNIDRDMAFTSAPEDPDNCDEYIVEWGTRNRIGDTNVKARAQWITGEILPNANLSQFFQNLPVPQALTNGVDWCSAIDLNISSKPALSKPTQPRNIPETDQLRPYRLMQ